MKRSIVGSLALLGLMGVLSSGYAADEEKVSLKELMIKINGHEEVAGEMKVIKEQLKKKDKADWEKISAAAKAITPLAEKVAKAKPPQGDEKSWAKFTKAYVESAHGLEEAAEKKDAALADAALKKGLTACGPCHKAHKSDK